MYHMKISAEKMKALQNFRHTLSREKDIPDIEQVAGMFPKGYLSIVASSPGTGKTWFMEFVTCQLSVGGDILRGFYSSNPCKVLIFSGETGADLLDRRLRKTLWEHDPDNIAVYSAIDMGVDNVPYMIDTKEGLENIVAISALERPDIIFFDTLISFHGKDESRQGDMTQIYLSCCRLARAFNCAVVCNHHTRKRPADNPNREQNQDDVIGTSAGIRLAHTVFLISSKDLGEGMSCMTVKNVKNWDKKLPPFSYKFVDKDGYIDFQISHNVNSHWSARRIIENWLSQLSPEAYIDPAILGQKIGMDTIQVDYYLREFAKDDGVLQLCYLMGRKVYKLRDGTEKTLTPQEAIAKSYKEHPDFFDPTKEAERLKKSQSPFK